MKTTMMITFYVFVGLFSITIIFFSLRIIATTDQFSDNVVIAFIGALAAFFTIIGSIYVAQNTANSNAKQQRDMEVRKLKQEYYHVFLEAMYLKFSNIKNMDCNETVEANKRFCIEVNRLPLYASQEVVESINDFAGGGAPPEFSILYELIRKDLCSSTYEQFRNLKKIYFQIPNKIDTNKALDGTT